MFDSGSAILDAVLSQLGANITVKRKDAVKMGDLDIYMDRVLCPVKHLRLEEFQIGHHASFDRA